MTPNATSALRIARNGVEIEVEVSAPVSYPPSCGPYPREIQPAEVDGEITATDEQGNAVELTPEEEEWAVPWLIRAFENNPKN